MDFVKQSVFARSYFWQAVLIMQKMGGYSSHPLLELI
jgi:hypothetical protein